MRDINPQDADSQKVINKAKAIGSRIKEVEGFVNSNNSNFCQEVMAHIERKGISKASFCKKTLLSERTFERIKSNSLSKNPRPETVMKICIGLALGFEYGESLFEKAGYKLEGSDLFLAYKNILLSCKSYSIYECDEILEILGLPVLVKGTLRQEKFIY